MIPEYYDKYGKNITLEEWAGLFGNMKYKVIEQTHLGKKYLISTVWLGLNHGFTPGSKLIFETMVFNANEDEEEVERYSTIESAKNGHNKIVRKYKERLNEKT